jgi:signal transduction histidine kinase
MVRQTTPVITASAAPPATKADRARSSAAALVAGSGTDRFFRHLVFNLRAGVVAITHGGELAAINDMGYRVLGVSPDPSHLGRPFAEVLHDCPEICQLLQRAFETDDLPNRAEMRLRRTGRAIGYSLSRIHDDDGHLVGATLFFKDLTRVEQMEERDRLRDRLAALGEMAAAIAHEVKNPLASIEVMAGVLKRQMLDHPEALETLGDIIKEAKLANAIVVEVLEFVRPIQLQVEHASLEEILKDSITMAEAKMRRGSVSIRTDIMPDVPALLADAHQLRQLFTNLLANAFEALGGEGHVDIRANLIPGDDEPQGGLDPLPPLVAVEVRDNGPGMGPDDLERIFSPFFTTKPQGTGLGLAIVRKVVDAHDGRITAVSAPGRGAAFKVTLPVVPSVRSMGR